MARCTRRPRAAIDLVKIWQSIARDDPSAADRHLDRIEAQCQLLASNPRLGHLRSEIAHDTRMWVVGRHLILYRALDDGIEIVRVVQGAHALDQSEL